VPPPAPAGLTITGWEKTGEIHFAWNYSSSEAEYFVFFERRDFGSLGYIGHIESSARSATYDGPCLADVACEYWMHAYRDSDKSLSASSNVVEIYRDELVGSRASGRRVP